LYSAPLHKLPPLQTVKRRYERMILHHLVCSTGAIVKRIVNIHQPNYIPALSYFAKMAAADVFVILDDVEYSKNNWTNRNRLKGANGLVWLTVPVRYSNGSRQLISEIEPVNESKWRTKHWRTLIANYSRAPCFSAYEGPLRAIYESEWAKLAALNEQFCGRLPDGLTLRATPASSRVPTSRFRVHRLSGWLKYVRRLKRTPISAVPEVCITWMSDSLRRPASKFLCMSMRTRQYQQCWGSFAERPFCAGCVC